MAKGRTWALKGVSDRTHDPALEAKVGPSTRAAPAAELAVPSNRRARKTYTKKRLTKTPRRD